MRANVSSKDDLPAIKLERHLQMRRFWLLRHTENEFVLVLLNTTVLGLTLREDVVRTWGWVPTFVDTVSRYLHVIDMFSHFIPFPTFVQPPTAIAWIAAFLQRNTSENRHASQG